VKFYLLRTAGSANGSNGTYVNRDHFSGLLELAFPLALLWAVWIWKKGTTRLHQPAAPALAPLRSWASRCVC